MTATSTAATRADLDIVANGMFDGMRAHGPTTISVRDGRISQVRILDEPTRPAAADVVATRFVMPGLVDAHVHITGYREGIPANRPYDPHKHFLRLCVVNGVTTLRDTGNSLETIAYAKAWSERYSGPRIVGSGPLLDEPPFMWPFSRAVADADDARREIDRLAHEGVDFIKLYRNIAPAAAAAAIAEAHARGLRVAGDLSRTSVVEACRAGLDSVEHAVTLLSSVVDGNSPQAGCDHDSAAALAGFAMIDPHGPAADALSAAMAGHGSALVPTFLVTRRWSFFDEMVSDPDNGLMAAVMPYHRHFEHMRGPVGARIGRRFAGRYMPIRPLNRDETRQALEGVDGMRALVRRLARDGIPIVLGTDSPNPSIVPGAAVHRELEELCRAGLHPVEALRAATSAGAELAGLAGVGVISPGAVADLLLLDADPTKDITATRQITAVILRGREIDRAGLLDKVREAAAGT